MQLNGDIILIHKGEIFMKFELNEMQIIGRIKGDGNNE